MTDASVQMVLGGFESKASQVAYSELMESFRFRWNEVKKAKARSSWQWAVEENRKIQLKGLVSTVIAGISCFDGLLEKSSSGEPLTLVDAQGVYHGKYIVNSIRKRNTAFVGEGLPRAITFDLAMTEYERE